MNENNKRIAKNTLLLYFRMMLIMGVTLYTSRIVLEVLGVEDFGIYNIVGGVVAMLGFLNSSMSLTTQRFMNFAMGKKDIIRLNQVFSLSVSIHLVIAVVIFVLAETVGLWFLNNQLTLPPERLIAANWIYHFSVLSAMVTVIQVPYNAAIIAYERMNVYAYISILEVLLQLAIVFALQFFGFDKLKLYAVLVFVVSLIIRIVYQVYCRKNFEACKFYLYWDKPLFKDIFSQSSWNLLGTTANLMMNQGTKIVLNLFFGVILNAAAGIATQVNSATTQLVTNFLTAMRPQIVRSFAEGKMKEMYSLIYRGSLFSFFLMLFITLPILFQTETILSIWLKAVPEYAVVFTQLVLIDGLINTVTISLRTAIQASGQVKQYQISVSAFLLTSIPIAYALFRIGFPPESVYLVIIVISVFCFCIRIALLRKIIALPIREFFKEVVLRIFMVSLPCVLVLTAANHLIQLNTTQKLLWLLIISFATTISSTFFLGLKKSSRKIIISSIRTKISKITRT